MARIAGSRIGHYVVLSPLGSGGMGEVFLARDDRLHREVALQLLPDGHHEPAARRRLLTEARLGARLEHPGICAIYEVGEHEGRDYIAMQRIAGETLATLLDRGALGAAAAIDLAIQIADAVAHAHAQGVIHRDLKAQNVMVTPQGRAVVLDFGLARMADPSAMTANADTMTSVGIVSGTPSAMSPEQARGEVLDARTDVFSFGILLYEMLAARPPFMGPTNAVVIAAILSSEPPPLGSIAPATSPELQRIVHKCLEKDRDLRYGSMREAAVDLERLKRGTSSGSSTPVPALAAAPQSRRRFASALALLLVVAAVAVALHLRERGGTSRPIRTLAVLPFRALSVQPQENYLGLGIADAVISRMSGDTGLMVRPTSAVRRYVTADTEVGRVGAQLNVSAVLEGTWQRDGDRLRVTANLLRTSDGASLWSDHFDAHSSDIFDIQDQISDQLASRLRSRLARRQDRGGTRDPRAYEAYTKGLFYFSERGRNAESRQNSDRAIRLFQEATRLDPNYALAHAQLGYAYAWTASYIDIDSTLITRVEQELATAEQLDPQLSLVHLVRGFILFSPYRGWRIGDAIPEFLEAERLSLVADDGAIAAMCMHVGVGWERRYERAIAQDPTNERLRREFVDNAYLISLPEVGRRLQKRLLGEEPSASYWLLVRDLDRVRLNVEGAVRQRPSDPSAWIALAVLRAAERRCTPVDSLLRHYEPLVPRNRFYHHITFQIAQAYALCGDTKEAVRWLDVTVAKGFPCYPLFERDWCLDPIRKTPEFLAFMNRLRPVWDGYRRQLDK